jgi:hypothetical protein
MKHLSHLSFSIPRSMQFQKKNARHFLHPPLSAPSTVHNRGLRHVGSAHVPHRRALSYMVYACSTRLSQLSSAAPPAHLWCFLSISLPPQEARNDAGVAKGPLAAWESKASLLMTKVTGDCGDMLKRAPRIRNYTTV